ncbi:hypothetical protein [Iodobacter sp.]|uniref:hypothetical protein n=1 Tax=Iodobacter sp. TaxID=1915058 RepID=UPI0025CDF655|nr:hypothetical protein [Iodobacter sp.]
MAKEYIEIDSIRIELADIYSVWVDQPIIGVNTESSSQGHYIGGALFLLMAGVVNIILRKNKDKKKVGGIQYLLNVATNNGTIYKFESNSIDIPEVLQELALMSRLTPLVR